MGKIVGWIIALALIALIVYSITSGLWADVFNPYSPPGR